MITMIIDGQWGSTGKGRLAAWHAVHSGLSAVVTDCGPNAGHTAVWAGRSICAHQLPVSAWVRTDLPIFLGPGSIINLATFKDELATIANPQRVQIHERAAVIMAEDVSGEQESMRHIASTMTGTGAAWIGKLQRGRDPRTAGEIQELWQWCSSDLKYRADLEAHVNSGHLMIESSQGFGLSIDHGFYPYTTHRNITPTALLDRCGVTSLPDRRKVDVWASLRAHPIRVGNVDGGSSGPCWGDQHELTWDTLGQKPELTSTTKRIRRVFSWSDLQYRTFLTAVRPTHACFSFLDYLPESGRRAWLAEKVQQWSLLIGSPAGVYFSTGPDVSDVHQFRMSGGVANDDDGA